jgi:hypothetical protein
MGLVAFAFDEFGNAVLEGLAKRAKDFSRPVVTGMTTPSNLAEDLSRATSGLLDPQDPARIERVHVLIVIDPEGNPNTDVLRAVCSRALEARKKFDSRMGRAVLAISDSFERVGHATNGCVRDLPPRSDARNGTGVDAFDLTVLLDTRKPDGSPSPTREAVAESYAELLSTLMLSDFEESIYRLLEHQRGPLGCHGLFASFGSAEMHFSRQEAVRSIENVLWRRMARKILQESTAPPREASCDSWQEEFEDRLAAEPFEFADAFWIEQFHRQAAEKLQRGFEESACHAGTLLRFLAQREEQLIRFRDRARTGLSAFMDEFVPRHGLPIAASSTPVPAMSSHREYGWTRIALLFLCLAGFSSVFVGGLIAASERLRLPGLFVLALMTGSAITFFLTRASRKQAADALPLPKTSPQRDVIAELRRHRACGEIAGGLLKRQRKLRKSIESDFEALQAELSRPYGLKQPGPLTLPESLIDELLTANGLDVQHALLEFWEQSEERLSTRPGMSEKSLPQRLRQYVTRRCAVFSELRMNDVLGYLGGLAALERPQASREIDRLQSASIPWMPVAGLASGMILAMPETLTQELRQSIVERFQTPVFVVSTQRESVIALQWTQGYTQAAGDANNRAMAL